MPGLANVFEPVAVTTRSGFDESVHYGVAVGLTDDGDVAVRVGDIDRPIYPRSSCKPIQTDAMLRAGWSATPPQIALACASHNGTPEHLAVVASTLAAADLDEHALLNTPDLPIDRASAEAHLIAGGQRSSMCQNCSGKHAAMVALAAAQGWDGASYLAPDHPVQAAITDRMGALAGPVAHVGVDGCGAPAHAVSLAGLARAFRSLAVERGPVWAAMTDHPELVGGDWRDVTRLMRAVPGLMAKDGAEGVFAAALPDGRAAVVKISDGGGRAAGVAVAAVLRSLDVDVPDDAVGAPILGHGNPVGSVRALIGRST